MMLLTLNPPAQRNAINGAAGRIEAALERLGADDGPGSVIIAGAGVAFSAGADLKKGLPAPPVRVDRMHRLVLRLRALPVISIAAIDRPALGGSAELAMACTFWVASPTGRMGLPETGLGLMPAYGETQTLSRLVGVQRALDMILWGEPVDAVTALAIRLAEVPGEVIAAAEALARRYVGKDRHARSVALRAIRIGSGMAFAEGLAIERAQIASLVSRRH